MATMADATANPKAWLILMRRGLSEVVVVSVLPFQQYLSRQVEQIPLLASPARSLARSTMAHARHDGQSGSFVAPSAGYPCVAMTKVWLSIAWTVDNS
jgi:hypothetical protein